MIAILLYICVITAIVVIAMSCGRWLYSVGMEGVNPTSTFDGHYQSENPPMSETYYPQSPVPPLSGVVAENIGGQTRDIN